MNKKKFAVNDWVIYGLTMNQVKSVEGNYYRVSDGTFETSGTLELRKATYHTKNLADFCNGYYKDLMNKYGRMIQNWPDIRRWFDARCIELIDSMNNKNSTKTLCDDTREFYNEIAQECNKIKNTQVRGISLYM